MRAGQREIGADLGLIIEGSEFALLHLSLVNPGVMFASLDAPKMNVTFEGKFETLN